MITRKLLGTVTFVAAALLASACAKKDPAQEPAELTDFRSSAKVERVWSANVGGAEPRLRLGLGVATAGTRVFAAGHNGDVVAFEAATGKRLWRTDTKLRLSGGPGASADLVVAGATHGGIVALDAATGAVKWKTVINSEVLAAPAVSKDVVLVRMVDGRVAALRATDGSQIWSAEQQVPRLSLRGTGKPLITDDLAVCGFDNGRVLALSLADGGTVWDVNVAPPSGRTELERLNDIDSAVQAGDTDIFAVTFQGKAARIDRETGQMLWSRDLSSYSGFALDEDGFYVSTSAGAVVKVGRRTGIELWKQEVLSRRRLSPPAVLGNLVAVADLDGYVHFLDKANGDLAARLRPLGDRVTAAPLVVGGLLIITDVEGRIAALRVVPSAPKG